MALRAFSEEVYDVPPEDRAAVPGGPSRPEQFAWRRGVFFVVAVLLCLTSNLVNALVSVNASSLMGALGVDSDQITWLPVVYSMTYVSMNLLLVRFRQQFGLRPYAMIGLAASCVTMALQWLSPGFTAALIIHGMAGVAAAPLGTLAVYYMMTAMPKKVAVAGVVLALGLEQAVTPFARLISPVLIQYDLWRSLYLFEFGLTLVCLGAVGLFRLPPSERSNVFRPLDFVTFALFAPGAALICAVLGLGATVWWPDRDWLAWCLVAAIPLLGLALFIESRRATPLLDLKWLSGPEIVRATLVSVISRLVLTEQSSAIGFFSNVGVNNDELQTFSLILTLCTIAGAVTAAVVFRPQRIGEMVALVLGLVAIAAFHDSHSSDLSRPAQFFVSQGLISFSTALFMGPALLFGVVRVLKVGGAPLASYLVLFVGSQNVAGLAGGALLNTFETFREKANSANLTSTVMGIDAKTVHRIEVLSGAVKSVTLNASESIAGGVAALQEEANQQATVLAYNNVFLLVAVMAAAATVYLAVALTYHWRRSVVDARTARKQAA